MGLDSRRYVRLGYTTPRAQHHSYNFAEDGGAALGVRSGSDPSSATVWKRCQEAAVTHIAAHIARVL